MGHLWWVCLAFAAFDGTSPSPIESYGNIPTYYGIITDWAEPNETVTLFDPRVYAGHLDYINRTRGKNHSARSFARQVSHPDERRYLPFLLYRLPEVAGRTPWVFRLQRYRYRDKTSDLARMATRAIRLVSERLLPENETPQVFLYETKRHRPNQAARPALLKQGLVPITLKEILVQADAPDVTILNPGTVIGRVVRAKDDGTLPESGARIIALYPSLPDRTPVLGGIVTLEAQTPLSHTNLLARARGTVNVQIRQWDLLPGLKVDDGAWVRLVATGTRAAAQPVSAEVAEAFWSQRDAPEVRLPKPRPGQRPLVRLGRNPRAAVEDVGAKAAQYGRLLELFPRHRVRPAWAVPFGPYLEVARSAGIDRMVDGLVKDAPHLQRTEIAERLATIRNQIKNATVPSKVIDALIALGRRRFMGLKIRLRSSTNAEDLPEMNGAGLYRSVGLKIKRKEPIDKLKARLHKKILKVYASLWSERAYEERSHYGIDHQNVAMAILVNGAFQNEKADGVAVTLPHTLESRAFDVIVNAQHGSGRVTHAKAGERTEAFVLRHGARRITVQSHAPEGPILLGDHPAAKRERRWLIRAMRRLHRRLRDDRYPGFGIDVELKVMGRGENVHVFLKQVRPLPAALPE